MIRALERRTPTRPAGGRSHASPPEAARPAPTPTPPRKPRASYSYFRTWSFFAGSRKHQPVHPSPPDRPAPDVEREHRMDALEKIRSRSSAASRIAASLRSLRDRFAGPRTTNKVSPMPAPRPAVVTTLPSPKRTPSRRRDPRSPRPTPPRPPPSFEPNHSTPSTAAASAPSSSSAAAAAAAITPAPTPPARPTPPTTPRPPASPLRTPAPPPPRRRIHVRVGTPPRESVETRPPPPPKEEVEEEEVEEEEAPPAAPEPAAPKSPPARRKVPIREMKAALAAAGLDASHCVEREDLEALYGTVGKRPRIEITEEREEEDDDPPSASSFDLFDSLPTEVNELILRELSPRSLAAATGVSRAWRDAAGDDELWAAHLARAPRFSKNEKPVPFPSTSARHSSRRGRRELMRTYAAARELGRRWRDGKYARCDLRDHSRPVERVEFADAVGFGRAAVTAGWDGFVFLYLCDENAVRGTGWRLARRFKGCEGAWVVSLATSPRAVVAGDTDGRICAWTFGSSTPARTLRQDGSVTKVRFVPNSGGENDVLVASASTLGDVAIWDLAAGTRLATLRGHAEAAWHVHPLAPNPDGILTVLTSSRDSTLRMWRFDEVDRDGPLDVPRGEGGERLISPASTWRDHDDAILSLAVSAPPSRSRVCDKQLCATCGADGVVVVRDVSNGEVLSRLTVDRPDSAPMCATFFERPEDPADFVDDSPISSVPRVSGVRGDARDGARTHTWLATGYRTANDGGELRLWDPLGGGVAAVLSDQSRPVSDVVATAHALVAVAPGDGVVVYAGVDDDDRRDARDGTARRPRGCPVVAAVTVLDGAGADGFSSCAGACDDLLAVGSKTGSVQLLDFRVQAGR